MTSSFRESIRLHLIVSVLLLIALPLGCTSSGGNASEDCPNPAPLEGTPDDRMSGYIVVYDQDQDWTAEEIEIKTQELAETYSFEPTHVYDRAIPGFAAELSEKALAGVRCEPSVEAVTYDAYGEID